MSSAIQLDAVNAVIQLTVTENNVVVDLSSANTANMVFSSPTGVTYTKSGAFTTDGTDGKLQYLTESGFLNEPGWWKVQVYLEFPGSGYQGYGEIQNFLVVSNLI